MANIKQRVIEAYNNYDPIESFFISDIIDMSTAYDILKEAIPNGWNNFNYECLLKFPQDWKIMIAKEFSPCIYVVGDKLKDIEKMQDEICFDEVFVYTAKDYKLHLEILNMRKEFTESHNERPINPDTLEIFNKLINEKITTTRIWWD